MRRREHERIVSELKRGYDREVQSLKDMLDRAMFMAQQTWTPPPSVMQEKEMIELPDYDWSPEQSLDATMLPEE